jgi:hypothetical protein
MSLGIRRSADGVCRFRNRVNLPDQSAGSLGRCADYISEPAHSLKVLRVRAVLVSLCLGIYSARHHSTNRGHHIIGAEATGEDNRYANEVYNTPADAPVVGDTKRSDLAVGRAVTVEQKVISYAIVGLSDAEALLA